MDYFKQPLTFKLKKVLRYLALYGPSRTYYKVLGQKHMQKNFAVLPPQIGNQRADQAVGIIGCGNYSFATIGYYLKKEFGYVIRACMDKDINRAASFAAQFRVPQYTDQADEIIENRDIRLIYIASNHATHAEYAIRALEYGKDVYIEKPQVVSLDQLHRLHMAIRNCEGKVFLGFNRPVSRFGLIIQSYLGGQSGAGMYNWFVIGQAIDSNHWYFNKGEGGRVMGNLCHWIDFTLRLVPEKTFPITIVPARYEKPDYDDSVSFVFGDGTIGSLMFTTKGQSFEGVRECFRGQKGNLIISMDDFERLTVEKLDRKKRYYNFHRDQGHRANIAGAYRNSIFNELYHREKEMSHVLDSAWLFLNTKKALERNDRLTIKSFKEDLGDIYSSPMGQQKLESGMKPDENINQSEATWQN